MSSTATTTTAALVTGGTKGIGLEYVKQLCAAGEFHPIYYTGRSKESLASAATELDSSKTIGVLYDTSLNSSEQNLLSKVTHPIGLAVLNASTEYLLSLEDLGKTEKLLPLLTANVICWTQLIELLIAKHDCNKNSLQIIGCSSISSFVSVVPAEVYCATRAYQSSLIRSLRHRFDTFKPDCHITFTLVETSVVITDALLSRTSHRPGVQRKIKKIGYTPQDFVERVLSKKDNQASCIIIGWIFIIIRFINTIFRDKVRFGEDQYRDNLSKAE